MMNLKDKHLQEWFEANKMGTLSTENLEDAKYYQILFEQLKEEPNDLQLPKDFTNQVFTKILAEKQAREQRSAYSIYALIILIGILNISIIIFLMPSLSTSFKNIGVLVSWLPYVAFGLGIFLLIQYLDKKLVQTKQFAKLGLE